MLVCGDKPAEVEEYDYRASLAGRSGSLWMSQAKIVRSGSKLTRRALNEATPSNPCSPPGRLPPPSGKMKTSRVPQGIEPR